MNAPRWSSKLPLIVLVLISGCTQEESPLADSEVLMQADRAFYQAVADHDQDAFRALLHPEAVFLGSQIQRGREAVAASWRLIVSGEFDLRWAPDEAHISDKGDLGYTIGTAEYRTPNDAGEIELSTATYVTIWRRSGEGTWQAVLDIGTPPELVTAGNHSPD